MSPYNFIVFESLDRNVGSCQGDSGGPMMIKRNGALYQVGVAQGANREDYHSALDRCGGSGLYTSISAYKSFIAQHLDQ
mgnify:CR=1 FL=1